MSGNKIDAVDRQFTIGFKDVCATGNDVGYSADQIFAVNVTRITLDEAPDRVAEASIPLSPTIAREVAHFIKPGGIPRFCNDLRVCQNLGQFDLPDHGWIDHR